MITELDAAQEIVITIEDMDIPGWVIASPPFKNIATAPDAPHTCSPLPTMAYMDDVAVFDDVVFAFDVEFTGLLELHFGGMASVAGAGKLAVLHDLGADEPAGDIGVNGMRRFHGGGAVTDRPGADFIFARGEEGNITERPVEQARQDVNAPAP